MDLSRADLDLELVLDRECDGCVAGLWDAREADRVSEPSVHLDVLLGRLCGLVLVCGLLLLRCSWAVAWLGPVIGMSPSFMSSLTSAHCARVLYLSSSAVCWAMMRQVIFLVASGVTSWNMLWTMTVLAVMVPLSRALMRALTITSLWAALLGGFFRRLSIMFWMNFMCVSRL